MPSNIPCVQTWNYKKNYFILDFYKGVISFQSLLNKKYKLPFSVTNEQTTHSWLTAHWN